MEYEFFVIEMGKKENRQMFEPFLSHSFSREKEEKCKKICQYTAII